jgi:hypothetical protein
MHILHFGISVTKKKTGFFGLMLFVLIKIMIKNKESKSSRWDLFIVRLNE